MMTANEIRASFLRFFSERGHRIVPSSPVIPIDDPTLLFTNAGMNQFKDVFLGTGTREYKRAADSQKCIRVSGKHNDLEEVGKDTYHHTFFEMLGNWSFGDYYKREAILWAWELLTKVWNLPKERLWATVFETDDEAAELWREVTDIDTEHILRFGAKENFWEMGETGPCGPCSEIHFDRTRDGAKPSMINSSPDVIEIWNLVFIQYNRNDRGELEELPAKHVDTGMGLERIVAILQGKQSNYDTDLFVPLIRQISTLTGKHYRGERNQVAMRVISDHVRALSFAIADGALPSNEGRGYVLRRLLRRASRYARQLDAHEPILHRLVPALAEIMGDTYPEVREKQSYIERVIRGEEENFIATLDRGMEIFDSVAAKVKRSGGKVFPGDEAFKLYDTFGFPLDLTQLMAREQGLTVDLDAFEALMALQRERAREALRLEDKAMDKLISPSGFEILQNSPTKTEFTGYDRLEDDAIVIGVKHEKENELVILDKTPFYVEAGGQVDDTGLIETRGTHLKVVDVIRSGESIVHVTEQSIEGGFSVGEHVHVAVDRERRQAIMRNHSATHLLHAALRKILGAHVHQAGSLVEPSRLRFDFTHFEKLDETALQDIEALVNEKIRENIPMTHHRSIPFDEAKKMGALMFFGEKYGDRVNIVQFGDFSMEFCGGTHVASTGDIGYFKIISEGSIASGVRRIEAITGRNADELIYRQFKQIEQLQHILNAEPSDLVERVSMLLEERRRLEKELADLRFAEAKRELQKLVGESILLDGLKLVTGVVSVASTEELKNIGDVLREQLGSGVGVLASVVNNKVSLVCVVTDDLIKSKKLQAGKIVSQVAKLVGGGGGGRAHLATAGGKDVNKMNDALRQIPEIIRSLLKGT